MVLKTAGGFVQFQASTATGSVKNDHLMHWHTLQPLSLPHVSVISFSMLCWHSDR